MTDLVIILTTVPISFDGEALARSLVDERLAACVNLSAPMTSVFRWDGRVEHETERQVVIKTTRERLPAVWTRVRSLHSYQLPEWLVIDIGDGAAEYLNWVRESTTPASSTGI